MPGVPRLVASPRICQRLMRDAWCVSRYRWRLPRPLRDQLARPRAPGSPASGSQQQVQCQRHGEDHERQRQDVRVHVAQQEAKERELVDNLDAVPQQILVMDHARRVPPPPESAGQVAGRRVVGELLYVQPLEPIQRNQTLVIRQLDQPFQVAQETDEQRAGQTVRMPRA